MLTLEWRLASRNHWTAEIVPDFSIEVTRPMAWKKHRLEKPWRVEVFGNPFVARDAFVNPDDAKQEAENIARHLILAMAWWANRPEYRGKDEPRP